MNNYKCLTFIIFIVFCLSCSKKQSTTSKPSFKPGFQIIHIADSTRLYKTNTAINDKLHFRLIDIDVWYPATNTTDSVLRFGNILGLLEQRANILSAPKTFKGLTKDIAKSFCEGFKCSQPDSLLNYPTRSLKGAVPTAGKFPLIIYLASYNAMSYDNYVLLEDLAKQGYVVASISSIGKYPGDMTMKTGDLMEQVYDAAFALKKMKNLDFVDSTRIGVVGYSWGGFAGAILAMSKSEIDAVISLDGSEFHHYGSSKEEDMDFDATVNSPVFKRASIKVPYFRLQSAGNNDKEAEKKDSLYNFEGKLIGKKEIYKIKSANHQDFSCLPSVVKESGQCPTSNTYRLISNLTIKYFNQILKQEVDAFDKEVASNDNKTIIPVVINEIN